MAIQATGRVVRDRRGLELFVERRVPAPIGKVRTWLKKNAPAEVTASAVELGETTAVYFSQRVDSARIAGEVGPVLEYTLDRLVASVTHATVPDLELYITTQQPYYERLAMDGDPVSWPPS